MKRSSCLDRRRFLQASTATAAAGTIVGCSSAGQSYRFLTDHEAATIRALADQIIPPDDYPGAGEAGADRFVDTQLVTHYKHWREAYRDGIAELDAAARDADGDPFIELTTEQQYALLEEREGTSFFRMVRDHSMQSYYGDPRHGGNPDAVSWKMLGVANPPVRGRAHYDLTEEEG
jgi:gluconate 2-dehydrogenase gamma chain